jgi:hypothetical protein
MNDQERERELARARAARWRAKHPGASAKAVAASRQRRKMKRDKADVAGVAAGIVKKGDIPERNFQRAKAALYSMLLEMEAKADRKKRDRSITAALRTARRVALQLWGGRLMFGGGILTRPLAMREIDQIEREFRKKGWRPPKTATRYFGKDRQDVRAAQIDKKAQK